MPHHARWPVRHLSRGLDAAEHRLCGLAPAEKRGMRGGGAGKPDLLRTAGLQLWRSEIRQVAGAETPQGIQGLRLCRPALRLLRRHDKSTLPNAVRERTDCARINQAEVREHL